MRACVAFLALFLLPAPASAVSFYAIDSVWSSTVSDYWPASNLIQGVGISFDAAEPHDSLVSGAAGSWVTDAPLGFPSDYFEHLANPVLMFDLGADVALTEISVWGYDYTNANGVSLFGLRFATDAEGPGGFGTSIAFSPTYALLNHVVNRQSHEFAQIVSARYVEFTALDNFFVPPGDGSTGGLPGGDRVGLTEVAFAVPEPASFLLVGAGLLVLARRRRFLLAP
jgi:hypothetical protein